MRLSVCIVNWNTRDYLHECLAALYANPPLDAEMEVIVVDNASADGSAAMVGSEFPKACLLAETENRGYAAGNNLGLARADGDWFLLLNPDVVVGAQTLSHALEFAAAKPNAGAIGARLLEKDGATQRSLRAFPDPLPVLWEYLGLSRVFPRSRRFGAYRMTYFDYDQPGEADQPMGSFLMIRRRTWNDVGPIDPLFPIFFNEVDWCWRAKRERGWKIYYTPDAVATHYGGGSTRQVKARMIQESHRSLLRFYEKHYKRRTPRPLYRLITEAILWNERRQIRAASER